VENSQKSPQIWMQSTDTPPAFRLYSFFSVSTKTNIMKPKEIVKSGYNQIYRKYQKKRNIWKNWKELNDLAKRLPKNSKILDVGCGSGIPVAKFLVGKKFDVIGIDLSENMVKMARKNVPNGKFYVMDMEKMKFPSESFDSIVAFYSIIHIPRKHHRRILNNFYRILKPSGFLLITAGFGDDEYSIENNWFGAKMYWSHFDKETNLELIKKAGFRIVWSRPIGSRKERHLFVLAQK